MQLPFWLFDLSPQVFTAPTVSLSWGRPDGSGRNVEIQSLAGVSECYRNSFFLVWCLSSSTNLKISCEIWNCPRGKFSKKKKPDAASRFWELRFPFVWVPAKFRQNGLLVQVRTCIRVQQTPKVWVRSSFGRAGIKSDCAEMGATDRESPK